MNAYVGRLRNVQRPVQLLRKSIFRDTFGTIKKKKKKKQLIKHRELGTKLPPKKKKIKEQGQSCLNDIGFSPATFSYQ